MDEPYGFILLAKKSPRAILLGGLHSDELIQVSHRLIPQIY